MKKALLISLLLGIFFSLKAQYKQSLGLAFGVPSGIACKTFTSRDRALDFTLGGFSNFFTIAGMYEIHDKAFNDVNWYYGPGGHLGSWKGNRYGNGMFLGLDAVLGVELLTEKVPFAFSLDIRPGVNLIGNKWNNENHWLWWQGQLALRSILK